MSASAALIVRSWAVGELTVMLTVPRVQLGGVMHAVTEWSPQQPSRLSADQWQQYRTGRNRAVAEIAAELRINVAVLDV